MRRAQCDCINFIRNYINYVFKMIIFILIVLHSFTSHLAKESTNLDRYLIACHTSDFECFKRQYIALRDKVLLGSKTLALEDYEPHLYQYEGSGTCVRLSGMEESELVAISMDSSIKEYAIILELPFRVRQVKNDSRFCAKPDRAFEGVEAHKGPMKRFSGNATIQVSYPYTLQKKEGDTYLILEKENLDVILDIPDLSHFHKNSKIESRIYEWSEWAYHVVQHTDVAEWMITPFTGRLPIVMNQLPLNRFILLYPEEEYSTLQFMFADTHAV